jgi:hypothetical protein
MPCRPVPDVELQLPGDTERLAFDGNCFITSSPRGAYTPDPARPGLFVSEPVPPFLAEPATDVPHRLAGRWELSDWDVVTALALEAHTGMLAVAASARLALFDLDRDHDGTRLGRPRWETRLMQPARWIGFDRKGHLLVGSHEGRDDDGTGWNACTGGTLAVRTIDGSEVARASVPDEAAWGYGSDPIVLSEGGSIAYVVDRGAGLHAVDLATGVTRRLFDGVASPTKESLGIGHALRIGRHLYAGFSRGGYRVFRYEVA